METSILELATSINKMTGNLAGLEFLPERPWDRSGKRFGSTDKAKRALGFEASIDLSEGLQRTIEWTSQHLPMIDACIERHSPQLRTVSS